MNENYVYNFQQGTYIKYDDVGFRVITGGILEKFSIPPEYREELIICKNLKLIISRKYRTNNVQTKINIDMTCFSNCV